MTISILDYNSLVGTHTLQVPVFINVVVTMVLLLSK